MISFAWRRSRDDACARLKGFVHYRVSLVQPSSPAASGNLLTLKALGYSDVARIAFALLRRSREFVWVVLGLLYLVLMEWVPGMVRDTGAEDYPPDVVARKF